MIKKFIDKLFSKSGTAAPKTTPLGKRVEVPAEVHGINPDLLDDRAVKVVKTLTDAGFEVVSNDKAMLRRRLAKGVAAPWEYVRYAALKTWTSVSKATRLRREIQLIARRPA